MPTSSGVAGFTETPLRGAAAGRQRVSAEATLRRRDAMRWLYRVAFHLWRMVHHLDRAQSENSTDANA